MNRVESRAAVYVRVSTDSAAQRDSPQHQIATCKEYALTHGHSVEDSLIYNDAGISGTELERRPEVQRLLADARRGRFDVVLFTAISRFSRDLSDALQMKKRLETVYGIRLISIEEGYDSAVEGRNNEMVFTVHAMLAAHKSREMSLAIQRGLKQAAKRGRHIGNKAPYGYRKTSSHHLEIDPSTGTTVRRIFAMYLAGVGTAGIARKLNEDAVPTASALHGKHSVWRPSTVHAILRNPVYRGAIIAHKWQIQHDFPSSRAADATVIRPGKRDEEDWVIVEDAHTPMVDHDAFVRVQALLDMKARHRVRHNTNLLSGLLVCEHCGSPMIAVHSGRNGNRRTESYRYFMCARMRREGRHACANNLRIRCDVIYEAVADFLNRQLSRHFSPAVEQALLRHLNQQPAIYRARIEELQVALEKNRMAQVETLRALQEGVLLRSLLVAEAQTLRHTRLQLDEELQRLVAQPPSGPDTCALESARAAVCDLRRFSDTAQRMVLRLLLDHMVFAADGRVNVFLTYRTSITSCTPLPE